MNLLGAPYAVTVRGGRTQFTRTALEQTVINADDKDHSYGVTDRWYWGISCGMVRTRAGEPTL